MGIQWTESQRKVIELSGRNILVSAAAGSGKTAVLVQRILEKITDDRHPVDIDRLLVVTFTNAAAEEMRDRVRQGLEERLSAEPDNERLRRQRALMPQAHITTIDSFCLNVVRSYFYRIDLDPSFRIGDEGEWKLMRQDLLEEMLNEYYREQNPEFKHLADSYATARSDQALQNMIERLYTLSQSAPWPEVWLSHCADAYDVEEEDALEQSAWMRFLLEYVQAELADLVDMYDRILEICRAENGPAPYAEPFEAERDWIAALAKNSSYREYQPAFAQMKWRTKPRRKKADTYDEELAGQASSLRDEAKKRLTDLKKQFFARTEKEVLEELRECAPSVRMLVRLTEDFSERFAAAKRRKNLLDFSDIEHMALRILTDRTGDSFVPSEVADRYSRQFEEILIDEYQDSNAVQEYLLNSISRERFGTPNVFMVGDVKQSIYAFRLAKPELFMEKYGSYSEEDSLYQKIELHQNFRSRSDVLHSVNYLFHQLMKPDIGKVDYTDEAALYPGAEYAPCERETGGPAELLLLNRSEEAMLADSADYAPEGKEAEYLDREWEAGAAAERILELTNEKTGLAVWDKEEGAYRTARYGDIVILLRTMSGWAEPFIRVLSLYGIPAQAESRTGYFSAVEVRTVLNLLQVLDNPAQDIPLAAVLHSPIVGMSTEELAEIKKFASGVAKDAGLYSCLLFYREHNRKGRTAKKAGDFLRFLEEYRTEAVFVPLHELLRRLYDVTGYYDYVTAMPAGARRRANLDMLIEKAAAFEATSYSGLFQFVRYIERLEKYEVDFGEADAAGTEGNAVRIMSIHKSKGLEFPIVFLCGAGKQFNRTDARAQVVLHADFGVGINRVDTVLRRRTKTLIRQVFQLRLQQDALGEELRILYVALTRAKEKLIVTGCRRDAHAYVKAKMAQIRPEEEVQSYGVRAGADSFLDWLVPAVLRHASCDPLYRAEDVAAPFTGRLYRHLPGWETPEWSGFRFQVVEYTSIRMSQTVRLSGDVRRRAQLECEYPEQVRDEKTRARLEETFDYSYRYGPESELHAVMSVSEIKKRELARLEEQEGVSYLYGENSAQKKERSGAEPEGSAAERGTATHRLLEHLSFREDTTLEEELTVLRESGILTEKDVWATPEELECFWNSPLAMRMKKAASAGALYREQPFVIGVLPEELEITESSKEKRMTGARVLVQGIIDAYFEEAGELVLVDYKTDRVSGRNGAEQLAKRYRIQLRYYRKALEQLTGMHVKQSILYSFCLGKAIPCATEEE